MIHRKESVYHCLVGLLASYIVAVNAGPITTEPVDSVAEDSLLSSAVPYEFPDDYSISLEQAVVSLNLNFFEKLLLVNNEWIILIFQRSPGRSLPVRPF